MLQDEQGTTSETILADGGSAIESAASLVVYLPARILGRVVQPGIR
jgi:hypothetical protein